MSEVKYRLRDVIDSISYDELLKMKKDLDFGGFRLKKYIHSKLKEKESEHESHCANCTAPLNPQSASNYTLVFGPEDFRKKASFCGVDCLEYFLGEIKQIKRVVK